MVRKACPRGATQGQSYSREIRLGSLPVIRRAAEPKRGRIAESNRNFLRDSFQILGKKTPGLLEAGRKIPGARLNWYFGGRDWKNRAAACE
jgi:hypothetical protein